MHECMAESEDKGPPTVRRAIQRYAGVELVI